MVVRRGSVCDGLSGLASEIVLTHPFLRPGTGPVGLGERRRKNLWRTTSWVLVALLHVLFFFSFVLGIRPFDFRDRPIVETILILPMAGNDQRERETINPQPLVNTAPRMIAPPINIPKPPPIIIEKEPKPGAEGQGPVDVLGAVGRELACSAGSWEHLTMVERQRCGYYPWRGVKLPNGSLVMIPRASCRGSRKCPTRNSTSIPAPTRSPHKSATASYPGRAAAPSCRTRPACM